MENDDKPVTRAILSAELSQLELKLSNQIHDGDLKLTKEIHQVKIQMTYLFAINAIQILTIIGSVFAIVKVFQ